MCTVMVLPPDCVHRVEHTALPFSATKKPTSPLLLLMDLAGGLVSKEVLIPLGALARPPELCATVAELVTTPAGPRKQWLFQSSRATTLDKLTEETQKVQISYFRRWADPICSTNSTNGAYIQILRASSLTRWQGKHGEAFSIVCRSGFEA